MSTIFRVDYVGLGEQIRAVRNEKHLTQAQLGEIAGLSEKHVGNIERAEKIPSLDAIVSICFALRIDPNRILRDTLPEDMLMLREIRSRMRSLLSEQYYPEAAESSDSAPADPSERRPIGFVSLGEKIPDQMLDFSTLFGKGKNDNGE